MSSPQPQSLRHPLVSFTLATVCLIPLGAPASAQTNVTVLPEIVNTASRGESELSSLPVSATVLTRRDIERMPASTVDDVLRQVPGLQLPLSNSNGNFPTNPSVALRGLGLGDNGTRTLVLIDGIPANGGYFGNVYWNKVPLERVERIEVVRGGGSGVFGSYALGGVINIITRPPEARPNASGAVHGGSFGTVATSVSAGTGAPDRYGVNVRASHIRSDGFFEVDKTQRGPIDAKTGYENVNVGADAVFDITPHLKAYFRGNYFDQDQGGTSFINKTFTNLGDVNAGVVATPTERDKITVNAFYQDERFQPFNGRAVNNRTSEFLTFTSISKSKDFGGSAVWTHRFGGVVDSISLGADARIIDGTNAAQTFSPVGALLIDEASAAQQRALGAFGEAKLSPHKDLSLLFNVRHDFYRNGDASRVQNGAAFAVNDTNFEKTSYRAAGRYQVTDYAALRAAAYRAFRAPTLSELYRSFGTNSFRGLANPNLAPETMVGGEVGATFDGPFGSRFEVTAFHNSVSNFIGGVPVAFFPVFTVENQNLGKIRSRGVETIATVPVGPSVVLTGSYTFLNAVITSNPSDPSLVGNRVEGAPRHTVTGGVRYTKDKLIVDARGRYLSAQFQDSGNETRLGSHAVFDLSLTYRYKPSVDFFLIGENILDRHYVASAIGGLRQIGAPAAVYAGIRARH